MSLDHTINALRIDLERLARVEQTPADTQSSGEPVQLARLQAAQAALKLAAVLLEGTDTTAAQQIWHEFNAVSADLATWKRSGRGWFEERTVRRGQKLHGPYRYFRWRDAQGVTHTRYLGRVHPPTTSPHLEQPVPLPLPVEGADPTPWRGIVQPVRIGSTKKVHLMLPEPGKGTTLCGRALGSQPLRAVVFQYDDCARCRSKAQRLGRVCATCGNPLVSQAGPEICVGCALEQHQAP